MSVTASVLAMLIMFSVLGLGVLVVLYGTVAKNKWGINLEPVSCPRCKTPLPRLYEPRSFRQAAWGGWTCPVCGAGVDKWGREVAPVAPPTIRRSEAEMRRALKKRVIICTAAACFCLTLLSDWTGVGRSHRWLPSTVSEALFQVVLAGAETACFTGLFYFAMTYLLGRLFPTGGGQDSVPGGRPGQNRQA